MNILHYTLGLPPYRTGGLTKYSFDLMTEQSKTGDNIFLLFPGVMNMSHKSNIKYYKKVNNIKCYEIINPLPVPLLNGVSNPDVYMKETEKDIFRKFLKSKKIDIIHIHSFMGLYKELLVIAKELGIKIFYTTHDYYGLCTKANLLCDDGSICDGADIEKCMKCNNSAYSMKMIFALQSRPYRFLKNKGVISKLKKFKSVKKLKKGGSTNASDGNQSEIDRDSYAKLLDYYKSMFGYIDMFLFNSSVSKEIYTRLLGNINGVVLSLTHSSVEDNRRIKNFENDKLRITYLGPDEAYKGYDLLINTINNMSKSYKDKLEVNLYGKMDSEDISEVIKKNGEYSYDDLEDIFDNTDLLVVPSIWYETFGFIVLEGLSYGVPVLATSTVGGKDLLSDNKGIIIESNEKDLSKTIKNIIHNKQILRDINRKVLKHDYIFDMNEHSKYIHNQYVYSLNWRKKA